MGVINYHRSFHLEIAEHFGSEMRTKIRFILGYGIIALKGKTWYRLVLLIAYSLDSCLM